jgi:hypothetical protein
LKSNHSWQYETCLNLHTVSGWRYSCRSSSRQSPARFAPVPSLPNSGRDGPATRKDGRRARAGFAGPLSLYKSIGKTTGKAVALKSRRGLSHRHDSLSPQENGAKSVTKTPDCIDHHDRAAGKAAFVLDAPGRSRYTNRLASGVAHPSFRHRLATLARRVSVDELGVATMPEH